MASWSKEFLLEFIELIRSEECLWKVTSKDYHNKQKREASYKILIDKVKEIDPLANKLMVTKKINTLRSSFRKELRKSEKYCVSGMSADDIYQPKLWYYDQLMFISDQEVIMEGKSSLAADSEHEGSDVDDDDPEPSTTPETTIETQSIRSQTPKSRVSSPASNSSRIGPAQFKRQKRIEDNVLTTIGEKISAIKREDKFDVFARNVAEKLRSLPVERRLYAEKKINDALFEAEIAAYQDQRNATIQPQYHNAPAHFSGQPNAVYLQQPEANVSTQFSASSNVSNYYANYNPNPQTQ